MSFIIIHECAHIHSHSEYQLIIFLPIILTKAVLTNAVFLQNGFSLDLFQYGPYFSIVTLDSHQK